MLTMKKSHRIILAVLAVLAILITGTFIAAGKIFTREKADLSGALTFTASDGIYAYDLQSRNLSHIKLNGYGELAHITGYDSANAEFFCSARRADGYYILKVSNGQVAKQWKIEGKPEAVKRAGETVIIALTNSVQTLDAESGHVKVLLDNVNINDIAACENNFVLWGETSRYIGEIKNGNIILNDEMRHDNSLCMACFINSDELLLFDNSINKIYKLNVSNKLITETDYNMRENIPIAVNGNKILCLYESNYTSQRNFFIYLTDKDKLARTDFDETLKSGSYFEWAK